MSDFLSGFIQQNRAKVDQELVALRELYESLREEDKRTLKDWIDKVTPVARCPISPFRGDVVVRLQYSKEPDSFRSEGLPPIVVKAAIEHWDREEPCTPKTLEELGI